MTVSEQGQLDPVPIEPWSHSDFVDRVALRSSLRSTWAAHVETLRADQVRRHFPSRMSSWTRAAQRVAMRPQRGRDPDLSPTRTSQVGNDRYMPVWSRTVPIQASDNPSLPETGFVRQSQLLLFIPFSKSTLWRRVVDGSFPAPIKLSTNVTAWRAEEVRRWIAEAGT